MTTLGSICTGYGGLDLAVEHVMDATTVWVSDIDPGANSVLAARFPDAPNLGDISQVDWAAIPPVDILTGGTPCQDLSSAGKRLGMTEGTRSNLWASMREAIATIRPRYVVWENVRGAFSAYAYSEVELEPGLLGEPYGPARPALRALGRVLGDLAELGYDASWTTVAAADIGAPHRRERVFVVATDTQRDGGERRRRHRDLAGTSRQGEADNAERERHGYAIDDRGAASAYPDEQPRDEWRLATADEEKRGGSWTEPRR